MRQAGAGQPERLDAAHRGLLAPSALFYIEPDSEHGLYFYKTEQLFHELRHLCCFVVSWSWLRGRGSSFTGCVGGPGLTLFATVLGEEQTGTASILGRGHAAL